jgi:hypothetical protein
VEATDWAPREAIMTPSTSRSRGAALLFLTLIAAACRGGDENGDDGTGPEVPGDPEAGQFAAMALAGEIDGILQHVFLPGGAPGCVTLDPLPFTDVDHDEVPDDLRFTFDLDGCKFTMSAGNWGSSSGSVRVIDPGATFGLDAEVQAMTSWTHLADHSPVWTISRERTGTVHLAGNPTQVTFTVAQTMVFRVTGEPDAELTMAWSGTLIPDGPTPFSFVTVNPGTLTLTGTSTFTRNNTVIVLSITTPTPLRWEPSCDAPWPQSGAVRADVVSGAAPGYLEITYDGCWQTGEVDFIPS